ncbi:diguanylate cyclase [Natronospira bacteriovora]|uniref:diguanylate cyclase n=1 Tax=Natronospira bacteriovora TaxID=3069753 RepID=A0ABU0W5H5_9GAMM|nr:diguanylate cyclase [Natronospira sp. AB-CW4]MDQ2069241.1 diguanylate cyclase [Natronospira sp. AB-CW4]
MRDCLHFDGQVRVALLALALLALPTLVSAGPAPEFARFEQLTIEDGLHQNTVGSLLQDRRGFIWIGTEAGLHRYDGQGFRLFRHEPGNPASLADNFAISLAEGADGAIWVGTMTGGIHRLDPDSGRVERIPVKASEPDLHGLIWDLMAQPDGTVWATSQDGVLVREPGQSEFRVLEIAQTEEAGDAPGVSAPFVAVTADSRGLPVFGTRRGLARVNEAGQLLPWHERSDGTAIPNDGFVAALFTDARGNLWVGGSNGVFMLPVDGGVRQFDSDHALGAAIGVSPVWEIAETPAGDLWFASYGGGLVRYSPDSGEVRKFEADPAMPRGLAENELMSLMVDSSGLVWVGTENSGLQRLNPQALAFGHFGHHALDEASLPNPVVWAIEANQDGQIWVGTQGGLARLHWPREIGLQSVTRLEPDIDPEREEPPHVSSLYLDPDGTLWIGSLAGLWRMESGASVDQTRYERIPLFGKLEEDPPQYWYPVYSVTGDDQGRLFLTLGDTIVARLPSAGGGERWFRMLGADRTGMANLFGIWMGAEEEHLWVVGSRGVARYDIASDRIDLRIGPEDWQGEGRLLTLEHGGVSGVLEEAGDRLWLATQSGLYRINPNTGESQRYDASGDLPVDSVYAVSMDPDGNIWASTAQGLVVIRSDDGSLQTFDVSDGLQSNEFNAGAYRRLPDGRMAFGGLNGINLFDVNQLEFTAPPPPVAITSVQIGSKRFNEFDLAQSGGQVSVPYGERFLSVSFTALDFRNLRKNRFEYRLQGFDEQWRSSDGLNRAIFTNLPPGAYVFQVRAANSLGIWNETGASLSVRVERPFWLHPLAYIAYSLLVLLLVFLGVRSYARRQQLEQARREEEQRLHLAEQLHRMSTRLAGSLDQGLLIDRLAETLKELVDAEAVAMFMEVDGQLICQGSRGARARQTALERVPVLLRDAVARTRQLGVVQLMEHGELTLLSFPEPKTSFGALVPVEVSEGSFGLLVLTRSGSAFTHPERDLLSSIGTQAMMALQKAELFSRVEQLATTDGLTGLLNRRHFEHCAREELQRASRYGHETGLLLIDLDHFKAINDRHGHEVGDRCLKAFGHLLVDELRRSDLLARFGGEEFIALLPETGRKRAMEAAERIRQAAEGLSVEPELESGELTLSVGVAIAASEQTDLDALIRSADRALYAAKDGGRNQVVEAD